MIKHIYERIGETVYEETLENGLHVFVFPKPEFGKCYAFFATRYGGMDTHFQLDGQWLDTPMGIAHYLEHKMFDTPDGGNALQTLSATGASPNAFTSTAITGYHFECTDQFWENLETLLTFVSVPYFTKESVEKEQGIIGQEIRMIEDQPGWQAYHLLSGGHCTSTTRCATPWPGRWSPSPTSRRRPCTSATLPSIPPPTWCCAWRGTWTRNGCARWPGTSCPRRPSPPSPGTAAGRESQQRSSARRTAGPWPFPPLCCSWASKGRPAPDGPSPGPPAPAG